MRFVKTHITPVSERFVIGKPMLLRVELLNLGKSSLYYRNVGVAGVVLSVRNPSWQYLPANVAPFRGQVGFGGSEGELSAGETKVLAEEIDVTHRVSVVVPGRYTVQFAGGDLRVGTRIPSPPKLPGDPSVPSWSMDRKQFVPARMSFPSNILEIEVAEE